MGGYRKSILRIFYDDQTAPSVESPVKDLLASAYTGFEVFVLFPH